MNEPIFPPQDSQPTRADAVKNHALLLDTAQRLFIEKGVNSVSMTEIAEAADVGKGTLYRHFQSKAELCHALLDQDMRDLQDRSLRRMRNHADPLENLEWFLEQILLFVVRNEALLSIHIGSEDINTLNHPAHLWWHQTIHALLRQIAPGYDVSYFTDLFYVMLDVHTLCFQRHTLGYDNTRILAGLRSTLQLLTT